MTGNLVAVVVLAALAASGALMGLWRRLGPGRARPATISDTRDATATDATGAVRSVQSADLYLSPQALQQLWCLANLERLARTYWRFLTRVTLGLIRVSYTERERFVVLLFRPLKLITFQAPEYEMDENRGLVRWRIERGLLVARRGRGQGYLQIELKRHPGQDPPQLHIEVEVANFYPAIALGISRWFYNETQSRIHVLITRGFLRSLARLDLAESRVGRFRPPGPFADRRRRHPARPRPRTPADRRAGDPPAPPGDGLAGPPPGEPDAPAPERGIAAQG